MFCTNCGKQIPDDSRFCEYCGTSVADGMPQNQQKASTTQRVSTQAGAGSQSGVGSRAAVSGSQSVSAQAGAGHSALLPAIAILCGVLLFGGIGFAAYQHFADPASKSKDIADEEDRSDKRGDKDTDENEIESESESESETEEIAEAAPADLDYFAIIGGIDNNAQGSDRPYQAVNNSDPGICIYYLDGSIETSDSQYEWMAAKEETTGEYIDLVSAVQWVNTPQDQRSDSSDDAFMNPLGIKSFYYYTVYRITDTQNEFYDRLFAYIDSYGDISIPEAISYEGEMIPVLCISSQESFNMSFPTNAQVIYIDCIDSYWAESLDYHFKFRGTKTSLVECFDCLGKIDYDFTEQSGDLHLDLSQNEQLEDLTLPDNGCLKSLRLFRCPALKRINSDIDGTYNIPEGTQNVDISYSDALQELNFPSTLTDFNVSSNDNLVNYRYQGTSYTDPAQIRSQLGDSSYGSEQSMEIDGILYDVQTLDQDPANRDGQHFSYIGKDYWQNNIYYDVWYENGYWRVKMDISEGGRDVHTTGYFDENWAYYDE